MLLFTVFNAVGQQLEFLHRTLHFVFIVEPSSSRELPRVEEHADEIPQEVPNLGMHNEL